MFPNYLKTGLALILFLIPFNRVMSQGAPAGSDTIYGFDPLLFNGRQYIYQIPPGSAGHPYLQGPEFQKGWITIAGREYQNLALNYDIVNQALLLKYSDQEGFTMVIEVSESWLTRFGIGNSEFEHTKDENGDKLYQVLENVHIRVLYRWQKELKLENVMSNAGYVFTPAHKTSTVVIHGTEYEYRKNKDFIKVFDPLIQSQISKYLKNNRIKVNNASDVSIQALVNYCNTLIDP